MERNSLPSGGTPDTGVCTETLGLTSLVLCYHGFEPGTGLLDKRSCDQAGKLPSARARCPGHLAGLGTCLGAQKQKAATKGLTDGEATLLSLFTMPVEPAAS